MDRWIIKKNNNPKAASCLDVPQYVEKLLKLTQ